MDTTILISSLIACLIQLFDENPLPPNVGPADSFENDEIESTPNLQEVDLLVVQPNHDSMWWITRFHNRLFLVSLLLGGGRGSQNQIHTTRYWLLPTQFRFLGMLVPPLYRQNGKQQCWQNTKP